MDAIIFTSNAGHTARYARLLGEATGLPVYSLGEAGQKAKKGAEIIYLGWLMAGSVKGYKTAARDFRVCAVCAVGMGGSGTQEDEVRQKNGIGDTPLFVLQGGFDITKLHGIYKLMMKTMSKTIGKTLSNKPEKTAGEAEMLELMLHGGDRVSVENLEPVITWWKSRSK
jgi:hypothetical protein